jgi:putative methyltransferase (TIGR04325 family)
LRLSWLISAAKKMYHAIYPPTVSWAGDYGLWSVALQKSSGYSTETIVNIAFKATEAVISGTGEFARDGVIFEQVEYNWQLVAIVHRLYLRLNRPIRILDFGGAFGDTFIQNRKMINDLVSTWTVVEQDAMLMKAQELPHVDKLQFDYLKNIKIGEFDLLCLSSVLQYLGDYESMVHQLKKLEPTGILVDRTGFVPKGRSTCRITLQTVRLPIYEGTYPCWFFEKKLLIQLLSPYKLIAEWKGFDVANISSEYLGQYFEKES